MQISLNLPEYAPITIERPEEQQIKYERTKEALEYEKEFVTLFKKLTSEFPDIAKYLKEIDSQDSATYNHVINVSLQSYVYAKSAKYNDSEAGMIMLSALLHDIGKVQIPGSILAGKRFDPDTDYKNIKTMMSHSLTIPQKYQELFNKFPNIVKVAALCHHIGIENLRDIENKNPISMKAAWKDTYTPEEFKEFFNDVVEIKKNSSKEGWDYIVEAVNIISFIDQVEAMRSNDRSYKKSLDWETDPYLREDRSIQSNIMNSVNHNELLPVCLDTVKDQEFRKMFDMLESSCLGQTRKIIKELTPYVVFHLSPEKIEQIKEKPQFAEMFKMNDKIDDNVYIIQKFHSNNPQISDEYIRVDRPLPLNAFKKYNMQINEISKDEERGY